MRARAYEEEPRADRALGRISAATGSEAALSHSSPSFADVERLVGETCTMRAIKSYLQKVASCDSNVLITGATGTGKEIVAELIHANSRRSQRPFVRINCAAIPETLIESELFGYERGAFTGADSFKDGMMKVANGGTVFFDEIGDLSLSAQAKILRAVETKEVSRLGSRSSIPLDVRILAATNRDLDRLANDGGFRRDLYFRLNVARIHLPSLKERREDIPALCRHYFEEFNRRCTQSVEGFTDDLLERLLCYEWPGNVRELRNLIEVIFVSIPPGRISVADLPENFRKRLDESDRLPRDERERLVSTLLATRWNKSEAALKLHWSRMTLYRKMAKYQIRKKEELHAS
jgi:two-component system response regulator HydG/two-component system response regulator AtoC